MAKTLKKGKTEYGKELIFTLWKHLCGTYLTTSTCLFLDENFKQKKLEQSFDGINKNIHVFIYKNTHIEKMKKILNNLKRVRTKST